MFADDTSVFLQHKDINMLYKIGNGELERIDQWLIANKVSINASKTKCTLFRRSQSKLCSCNNQP